MVTLLLILMMACNLWVLLYLTWERKESRKADGKDGIEPAREPLPDVIGKSRFRMPEMKPQAATPTPNAATEMQSEAVDEKDVTFDDEMETAGSHTAETKPSRQVPTRIWTRFSGTTASTTRTGSLTGNRQRQAEVPLTKLTVRQGR